MIPPGLVVREWNRSAALHFHFDAKTLSKFSVNYSFRSTQLDRIITPINLKPNFAQRKKINMEILGKGNIPENRATANGFHG